MTFDANALVQFATEFALFLVALAGLALVVLRTGLAATSQAARFTLAVAFLALLGAAFAHGSLLVNSTTNPALEGVRALGWVAVALGILRADRGFVRGACASAVVLGLAGTGAAVLGADLVGSALQGAAAITLGAGLLYASRKAIAARVAASSAATLLLVVLVLSVGLSAVLSNNVADQAVASLDARAEREANAIEASTRGLIDNGQLTANSLKESRADIVRSIALQHGASTDQVANLEKALTDLSDTFFGQLGLTYVDQGAGVIATANLTNADAIELLGSSAVQEALRAGSPRGAVQVFGRDAFVVGVAPLFVDLPTGSRAVAAVVAATKLDNSFLNVRATTDERVGLELWSRTALVSRSTGASVPTTVAARLGSSVLRGDPRAVAVTKTRFVAAKAVRNVDRPVLALVASRPTTAVATIRENLFRTFFVIAFGGALLALVLAALIGDRIGAGVRRLTRSAERLQEGDLHARSGIRSEDEVGRLGLAFDAMAESIEEKTDALRDAAADEARLRNRVEAIVAGMGEALVAVDEHGDITDFNQAGEELLGVTAGVARGRPFGDVVKASTEDGADVAARLQSDGGLRWSALGELVTEDGSTPIAVTVGPLRGPAGEHAGRVVVMRDLRAEREIERMKQDLISRLGHELRTPLTPLLGYARLLANRPLPADRAKDVLDSMLDSGDRLLRIVEMLEFFASIQAGRAYLKSETVNVRELVGNISATSKGHPLVRRVARETPNVMADARWLQRSVDELVDNAYKFSPEGGRVTVTAGPTPDGLVEIAVRDAGIGMTEEELERAFAEFVQVDESDTRHYGGLGLGLTLVQRVVELHGGRVSCETAPGKGSKFSILLPGLPTVERDATVRRPRVPRARRGDGDGRVPDGGTGSG
jgi:PAS domain S-box-containing protein